MLPACFGHSMRELELISAEPPRAACILQAVSHETAQFERLHAAWGGHPGYRYLFAAAPHDWNYVDNFGGILLPQPVIQARVNWMV
jgi:hypothetical protein